MTARWRKTTAILLIMIMIFQCAHMAALAGSPEETPVEVQTDAEAAVESAAEEIPAEVPTGAMAEEQVSDTGAANCDAENESEPAETPAVVSGEITAESYADEAEPEQTDAQPEEAESEQPVQEETTETPADQPEPEQTDAQPEEAEPEQPVQEETTETPADQPEPEQTDAQPEEAEPEQTVQEETTETPAEVLPEAPEEPAEDPEEPGEEPEENVSEATDTAVIPEEQPETEESEESITDEEQNPEETEEDEPDAPEANRELSIGDDVTVSGELNGESYLIRFTPDKDQTIVLMLTSEKALSATVTEEQTGKTNTLSFYRTDEKGANTQILAFYKVKTGNTYLVRITGTANAAFSLRLVKNSVFQAEEEKQDEPRSVHIDMTMDTENPQIGDMIHFNSVITGYENIPYTLQWQTSRDGAEWTDYAGATEPRLDITLTEETSGVYFRLVIHAENEQQTV